jgi:hypothetical protein
MMFHGAMVKVSVNGRLGGEEADESVAKMWPIFASLYFQLKLVVVLGIRQHSSSPPAPLANLLPPSHLTPNLVHLCCCLLSRQRRLGIVRAVHPVPLLSLFAIDCWWPCKCLCVCHCRNSRIEIVAHSHIFCYSSNKGTPATSSAREVQSPRSSNACTPKTVC